MNIYGKKVVLRAMEKSDCEMVRSLFNDPEIEDLVVGWAFPISAFAQEQWINNHYNDQNNMKLIIETKEDGAVGLISLNKIDWKNRCASHGIKIAQRGNRAKGIGTDAVMAIMRYAFDELGLHRLETSRFDSNTASKKLYDKCGWVEEGVKRKCVYKHGVFKDLTIVGILASEYYELIEKNHYWD